MKKSLQFITLLLLSLHLPLGSSANGPWTQKASMPGLSRHRIFAITIGSRGYIGCGWNGTDMYSDVWEYDPGSNSWSQKADYPGGPRLCPFGFSIGNKGYVGAGLDQFLTSMDDFYEFDPVQNSWTPKANFGGSPRFGCASAVINNKGYVAMGDEWDPNYYRQNDLWRYDPAFNSWNYVSNLPADGRRDPVGFRLGTKLYFGTGSDNSYMENNDFWEYDPSNGAWTQKANCGLDPRAQATGFAVNGKGYIGLGQVQTGADMNDFLEYDPLTNNWRYIDNFAGNARENSFSFVIGNLAYVTCGTSGINYNDLWEFNPAMITGSPELQSTHLVANIFPNPLHETSRLEISGALSPGTLFTLYDALGKKVQELEVNNTVTTIQRNGLPAGNYFYRVLSGNVSLAEGKLLVQ